MLNVEQLTTSNFTLLPTSFAEVSADVLGEAAKRVNADYLIYAYDGNYGVLDQSAQQIGTLLLAEVSVYFVNAPAAAATHSLTLENCITAYDIENDVTLSPLTGDALTAVSGEVVLITDSCTAFEVGED